MKHATDKLEMPNITSLAMCYPEARALGFLVDDFARRMFARLIEKWIAGRRGWCDRDGFSRLNAAARAHEAINRHDWVDAANWIAFAWNAAQGEPPASSPDSSALNPEP